MSKYKTSLQFNEKTQIRLEEMVEELGTTRSAFISSLIHNYYNKVFKGYDIRKMTEEEIRSYLLERTLDDDDY